MVAHSLAASVGRHLCCLPVLASVNSAAMNTVTPPMVGGKGISCIPRGRVATF